MTAGPDHCVLLIVDGLGDLPVPLLGDKTPLDAAHTPNLDHLAGSGCYGEVDPIEPDVTANTHSGAGLLLGIHPDQIDDLRRGPVEAAGAGRELQNGEIAVRVNFASLVDGPNGLLITDRRAGRISDNTRELAASLDQVDLGDGVFASLQPTDQHRAVLVLSGPGLDDRVTDTDPGDGPLPVPMLRATAINAAAQNTADKINQFVELAYRHLNHHPVNRARIEAGLPPASGVITRGAGQVSRLDNVVIESGLRTAVVCGCNTISGLGRLFGFDILNDPRFTADLETDLEAKVAAAIAALQDHDLVYMHFKAPDICSHDRQPAAKRDYIERLDKALAPLLTAGAVLALTADHATNSNTGFHTADPVPSLLFVAGEKAGNGVVKFGEQACKTGTMNRQTGTEFLRRVLASIGINNRP